MLFCGERCPKNISLQLELLYLAIESRTTPFSQDPPNVLGRTQNGVYGKLVQRPRGMTRVLLQPDHGAGVGIDPPTTLINEHWTSVLASVFYQS